MIGVVIRQDRGAFLAVSPAGVWVDSVPKCEVTSWLTEDPAALSSQYFRSRSTSWGSLAEIFHLDNRLGLEQCRGIVSSVNRVLPKDMLTPGVELKSAMNGALPTSCRVSAPFPAHETSMLLNEMRICSPTTSTPFHYSTLADVNLTKLWLPHKFLCPKRYSNPKSIGRGLYEINFHPGDDFLSGHPIKEMWVTNEQAEALKLRGEVELLSSIQVSPGTDLIKVSQHPIIAQWNKHRNRLRGGEKLQWDNVVIRFLLSIPRPTGINPYSVALRGGLWCKALDHAMALDKEGYSITSLNYLGVVAEVR